MKMPSTTEYIPLTINAMKVEIGVAVSIEPITIRLIDRVARHLFGARVWPASPATVKIIGICEPRIA